MMTRAGQCPPADRSRGQAGAGEDQDAPGRHRRTRHAAAVRPVHPPWLGGQRVPRRPPRPARRQRHRPARHHRGPARTARHCHDDPRHPVGDRRGRSGPAPRGHRQSRSRARRPLRLQPGRRSASTPAPSSAARRRVSSATDDAAAILELDADVVLHAASKAFRDNTNTDDIVALLESGKNVITTTSYNHLPTFGPEADDRINRACAEAGTRFHAAGEHPGLHVRTPRDVAHRAVAARRQDHRAGVRRLPSGHGTGDARRPHGHGQAARRDHDRLRDVPRDFRRSTSSRWRRPPTCSACESTRSGREIKTATVPYDIEVACGTLPAGSVVGQILSWTAYRAGVPVLVAEEYWTVTDDIPEWDVVLDGQFLVRVIVDGSPPLRVDLTIGNDPDRSRQESRAASSRWR